MRMTLHSDYALRLLIFTGLAGNRLVSTEEVANAYGLSKNHLMKVIQGLAKGGYLKTVRGRGGGFQLAANPADICVGVIIRQMEKDFAIVECLGNDDSCAISGHCRLTAIVQEAMNAWFAVLDKYSLADLLKRPAALRQLLGTN